MKDKEYYQEQSLNNIKSTSRTLKKGSLNTKASAGKWRYFQSEILALDPSELKTIIKCNYRAAINKLYAMKDKNFGSAEELKKLVESIASIINASILQKGCLIRAEEVTRYPYTPIELLRKSMEQFYEEFYDRLQNMPKSSNKTYMQQWAIITCAWIEYRINLTDHFFSDGCGKVASAMVAFICMRADIYLPETTYNETQYTEALPKKIRDTDNTCEDLQFEKWLHFYFTRFKEENDYELQFEMTL